MGVSIPQVVTETKASGAQIIDGSLKFDQGKTLHLTRTPSTDGNKRKWTWSGWVKPAAGALGDASGSSLFAAYSEANYRDVLRFGGSSTDAVDFQHRRDGSNYGGYTNAKLRDYGGSGWYHVVLAWNDGATIYVNGVEQSLSGVSNDANNGQINNDRIHYIGARSSSGSAELGWDGQMSQIYFVDGQELDASYFGYTDGLTNTWRPKKFGGSFTQSSANDGTTWSSSVSGPVNSSKPLSLLFGGTIGSGYANGTTPTVGNTLTLNIASLNLNITNVRLNSFISRGPGGGGTPSTYTVNGTTVSIDNSDGDQTNVVAVNGQLNTIAWSYDNGNGPYVYMRGIEVDLGGGLGYELLTDGLNNTGVNSFYLPMDGNSPIGEDKSGIVTINDGRTWSNSLTSSSGFRSSEPKTNAFDGNTSSICSAVDNGVITFTSPVTFASSSIIKVVVHGGDHTVTVNGGADQTISAGSLQTVTYSNSGNATFVMTFQRATVADTGVRAIEINGVILTDGLKGNSWTPVNFGGSVALDNPIVSGARPILNTDGGGNVARPGVFGSEVGAYYAVTVSNPGSGNKYYLDGVLSANPTLTRGATYTFDQSDSSNSGHPLVFGTTAEGNNYSDGVTTNGTPGSAGAYTKITVPHNAPDTLYYHCSVHSGMGSSTSQITDETKADPYAWKNFLALPLVGSANDVSNSVNSGSTAKVATNSSVDASSVQSNFYSGSHHWSANSDTLQYAEQGSELVFGSGDYTIECWLYDDNGHNGTGNRCYIFDNRIGGSVVGDPPTMVGHIDSHNEFNFYDGTNTITHTVSSTVGKWWHYAVTREGTTTRMFIDGVLRGSNTSSTNFTNNGIGVGRATDVNYGWAGYIQDFRVYNGIAKYTSDFVVPATSPDILPDTPSGVSGSSKLAKVIDGAVSFDGSGDKLTSNSTDFVFGTSSFTVEAFVYKNSTSTKIFFSQTDNSAGGRNGIAIGYQSGALWILQGDGSNWSLETTVGSFPTNKWVHIAVSRDYSATKTYYFIDGQLVYTYETNINLSADNNGDIKIGSVENSGTTYDWDGFISNFRVLKGTALYTANFTPPSATPLTNVTNTKLLCCQSNTLAGAATVSPNISGINDGIVWSEEATITAPSSGFNSGGEIQYAFDGSTTSMTSGAGGRDESFVIDFSRDITVSTSLEVWMNSGASQFKVNDGSFSSSLNNGAWRSLSFTGTLSKLTVKGDEPQTYGNFAPRLSAIRIDGSTILTDPVTKNGNAAATNFNPFTTDINTVRGQETGYATLNPLSLTKTLTLSDGNLGYTATSAENNECFSNIRLNGGKFYFESNLINAADVPGSTSFRFGICKNLDGVGGSNIIIYNATGNFETFGTTDSSPPTYTAGNTIGVSVDCVNGSIQFFKDGVSVGTKTFTVGTDEWTSYIRIFKGGGNTVNGTINFGQKPFKFPPPDGFQPLNAANVRPETVITRPDHYVGTVTYTGDGNSPRKISGYNFAPDLIWYKQRNSARDHQLYDTVRGDGTNKNLSSNTTYSETANDDELYGYTSAFNDDGFTVTEGSSNFNYANASSSTYVAWTWRAGGNKNTFNVDDVGYANASDVGMSVGALNSAFYNTSQVWSDDITKGTGNVYSNNIYVPVNIFNGNTSSYCKVEKGSNSNTVSMQLSSTISGVTKIRVNTNSVDNFNINGGSNIASTNGYQTIYEGSAITLSDLDFTRTNGVSSGNSDTGFFVYSIEINGLELLDSGVTPSTNFPSIAATGASVGTRQGFSIIKYTGTGTAGTISHGLLEQPKFVIIKDLKNANAWAIQHVGTTLGTGLLKFNTDDVDSSVSGPVWNSTAPTSSVFSVGTSNDTNGTTNSAEYITYLWHDVPGLQKFGSYIGNQNADGPFVELGFRPAILWVKASSVGGSGYDWYIHDSSRNPINVTTQDLALNDSRDEVSTNRFDLLSNGFKIRGANLDFNKSAATFIYCAWAEAPTFNLYGGQSNAR